LGRGLGKSVACHPKGRTLLLNVRHSVLSSMVRASSTSPHSCASARGARQRRARPIHCQVSGRTEHGPSTQGRRRRGPPLAVWGPGSCRRSARSAPPPAAGCSSSAPPDRRRCPPRTTRPHTHTTSVSTSTRVVRLSVLRRRRPNLQTEEVQCWRTAVGWRARKRPHDDACVRGVRFATRRAAQVPSPRCLHLGDRRIGSNRAVLPWGGAARGSSAWRTCKPWRRPIWTPFSSTATSHSVRCVAPHLGGTRLGPRRRAGGGSVRSGDAHAVEERWQPLTWSPWSRAAAVALTRAHAHVPRLAPGVCTTHVARGRAYRI